MSARLTGSARGVLPVLRIGGGAVILAAAALTTGLALTLIASG